MEEKRNEEKYIICKKVVLVKSPISRTDFPLTV